MLSFQTVGLILSIQQYLVDNGSLAEWNLDAPPSVIALENMITGMINLLKDGKSVNAIIYNDHLPKLWDEYLKQRDALPKVKPALKLVR